MALIRATCSDCGDVELRSRDILVRTCEERDDLTFVFRCPVCRMVEVRPAEPHVVDVLLAAGCNSETWRLPKELNDPRRTDGMCVTHDQLLDFHWFLADATAAQILEAARPVSAEDQEQFFTEVQHADSHTIARELNI